MLFEKMVISDFPLRFIMFTRLIKCSKFPLVNLVGEGLKTPTFSAEKGGTRAISTFFLNLKRLVLLVIQI